MNWGSAPPGKCIYRKVAAVTRVTNNIHAYTRIVISFVTKKGMLPNVGRPCVCFCVHLGVYVGRLQNLCVSVSVC